MKTLNNTSKHSDEKTARTRPECAEKRATHLFCLGARRVLELCVGPSLRTLQAAYAAHSIECDGNDLEIRWKHYYPEGRWLLGDALTLDYSPYDAVVFAPPVSRGCSGKREDSLTINEVTPGYRQFLKRVGDSRYAGVVTLVLPARSLATSFDREQLYALLSVAHRLWNNVEMIPISNAEGIRNYLDIYCHGRKT